MPAFFDNDNYVYMLDALAHRYGKRPSEILEIEDGLMALDFDLAIMVKAKYIESEGTISTRGNNETAKLKAQFAKIKSMQLNANMSRKR